MTSHGFRTKPVFASGIPAWGVDFFPERQALTPRSLKKQLCGPKASETAGGHFLGPAKIPGLQWVKNQPLFFLLFFFLERKPINNNRTSIVTVFWQDPKATGIMIIDLRVGYGIVGTSATGYRLWTPP